MDLESQTSQLYIVDGHVQDGARTPGVHLGAPPPAVARGRQGDQLFLHFSLTGRLNETAPLLDELVEKFVSHFYATKGGVTAAMRQSVIATNQFLLHQNLEEADDVRREGALHCSVLRGDELFTAQVGEAFAHLGHNFGLEPIPSEQPEDSVPFGRQASLNIRFFHHRLQEGNVLLIGDPLVGHLNNESFVKALVGTTLRDARAELLRLLATNTARLILIGFGEEVEPSFLEATVQNAPQVATPVQVAVTPPEIEDSPAKLEEIRAKRRAAARLRPVEAPRERPRGGGEPVPIAVPAEPLRIQPVDPEQPTEADLDIEQPLEIEEEVASVNAANPVRQAASGTLSGMSRFSKWLAQFLTAFRSTSTSSSYFTSSERLFLLLSAFIIPIIVGVIGAGVYIRRQETNEFTQIRTEIRETLALAQDSADTNQSRIYYGNVLSLARRADELDPDNTEVGRARETALAAVDQIDGVKRLDATAMYTYGETANLTAIELGGDDHPSVYVLDSSDSSVYRHEADTEYMALQSVDPQKIISAEQAVGPHITNRIIDLTWRPAGFSTGRNGIEMLDVSGSLISYYPDKSDARAVPLVLSSEWQQPTATSTWKERMFMLDTGMGRIWRYLPEGAGFRIDADREPIELDGLAQASNFVIDQDGGIIVLYADGRLRRYFDGRLIWDESTLSQNGLLEPMQSPTTLRIAESGATSSIFVLDPGTNRLIEFSMAGTVLGQFKATLNTDYSELFANARDFSIKTNPLRIFIISDNVVAIANLTQ